MGIMEEDGRRLKAGCAYGTSKKDAPRSASCKPEGIF